MRESFVFYKSFFEAISLLPDKGQKADLYEAMAKYAFFGTLPNLENDWMLNALFILIKPQLDANDQKAKCGAMGGRPKTNGYESEKPMVTDDKTNGYSQKNHRLSNEKPMVIDEKTDGFDNENQWLQKIKPNDNVNDNVNVNDNIPPTPYKGVAGGYPDADGVLKIAKEVGAKCHTIEDAELYLACRERNNWKVNGIPVANVKADVKAFFLSKESNDRAKAKYDSKAISQDYSGGVL